MTENFETERISGLIRELRQSTDILCQSFGSSPVEIARIGRRWNEIVFQITTLLNEQAKTITELQADLGRSQNQLSTLNEYVSVLEAENED